jgi:FkbM family methyltransferase
LGKYIMFAATGDISITPHLALNGIWEPWVTMAIARHLKPGMRCMDIGACYGYYSLLMADIVGPTGSVQAWEPVWNGSLLANININGFDVDVRPQLMGTEGGVFEFTKGNPPFNAGDIKLTRVPPEGRRLSGRRTRIMGAPGSFVADFIKIDVEGAEADVWQALAGVRAESPNLTVCMEFTPSQHENPDRFLLQLVADGFELGTVGHDGVPRAVSADEAIVPDTGGFRMLWLTRRP